MLLTSIHFVNMTTWVRGLPFFSFDETQEQHIGHCESTRRMLGVLLRYFSYLVESCLTEAYFIYMRAENNLIWPFTYACLSKH